jgi:hypothetical protein
VKLPNDDKVRIIYPDGNVAIVLALRDGRALIEFDGGARDGERTTAPFEIVDNIVEQP